METRQFFLKMSAAVAASCWLFGSGLAMAADAPAASSASTKAAPPSKPAGTPPALAGGFLRPPTAEDEKVFQKERAAQMAARSKEVTELAQKDLDAKQYDEALKKVKVALELDPKNKDAARIKKKATQLAKK
jgi:hypothetical protein